MEHINHQTRNHHVLDYHGEHHEVGHDNHAGHNVSDFWKRFIVCSIVSMSLSTIVAAINAQLF